MAPVTAVEAPSTAVFVSIIGTEVNMQGIVKWFKNDKGYGFIVPNDGSSDVFVHYTAIEQKGKGRRSLEEGQEVEFDAQDTPKGRSATRVSTSVTRAG